TWDKAASAIAYEAEWRKDNGNWVSVARTSALGFEITGIYAGAYQARVRAINASDISSIWANAVETQLNGKEGAPPKPVGFSASTDVVFGITLTWGFPNGAEDTLKTEIQYSTTATGDNPLLLSDVPYPQKTYQQSGLAAGVTFYYRAQLVDKTGNESGYTDWIVGSSSSDSSEVLSYLTGQITETQLGQDLLGPVQDASQLKDMWSVKVGQTEDGKLYTAGIGVGVENTPAGMQ
ncbi:phage tail tip fiber protein, partial [Martelella alba]